MSEPKVIRIAGVDTILQDKFEKASKKGGHLKVNAFIIFAANKLADEILKDNKEEH